VPPNWWLNRLLDPFDEARGAERQTVQPSSECDETEASQVPEVRAPGLHVSSMNGTPRAKARDIRDRRRSIGNRTRCFSQVSPIASKQFKRHPSLNDARLGAVDSRTETMRSFAISSFILSALVLSSIGCSELPDDTGVSEQSLYGNKDAYWPKDPSAGVWVND
jgi:hypothetical protein